MFKINPNPTFKAKVEIQIPGGEKQTIECEFKHRTATQLKEWLSALDKMEEPMKNAEFVLEFVIGWSGVDVPFSKENVAQLVDNYHTAASSMRDTYLQELTTARLGN